VEEQEMLRQRSRPERLCIRPACDADRETIYRLRHTVYSGELGQHLENTERRLRDALDGFNHYIVAEHGGRVVGFVSVTPPGYGQYSIDKYLDRSELPFDCDDGLYEVRILTVIEEFRTSPAAGMLMYAAWRWIEDQGGSRIVAIGRREVLSVYLKTGMRTLGREIRSGAVTFELMAAEVAELRQNLIRHSKALGKLEETIDWQMGIPFLPKMPCLHGGDFFGAVGVEFDALDRRKTIINADVLDAWFRPAPEVIARLQDHLDWIIRTSPPTQCEGMVNAVSQARNISRDCIVPAAGSSNLIFSAFREWLSPKSRVLILDPTYGEYPHVLEQVIGCEVDRLPLDVEQQYQPDLQQLESHLRKNYDLVVLVNPNSPTGRFVARQDMESLLRKVPRNTRVWIDETYIDYVGSSESLEKFASESENIIVCKSMSKVYALSGVRAAYLCTSSKIAGELRSITPPWAVSLPAQIAPVTALQNTRYYEKQWEQTARLREQLEEELRALRLKVIPGVANFIMVHLPQDGPSADEVGRRCREQGLFLRDLSPLSPRLGKHTIRIAVKDQATNQRMLEILTEILHPGRKEFRTFTVSTQ
jgi:histidinol-phosphate/aromatic aminotransferase/cobyric acid decarboxylase-like protein